MAVGRDVVGADGLINAERYAKRLADKKAKRAAWLKKQDAKKTAAAPSVSSPSNMFGSLLGATQPTRSPAPAPQPSATSSPSATTNASSMFGSLLGTVKQVTTPAPTATLGFGHQQPEPIKTPPAPTPEPEPTPTPEPEPTH